MTAFINVSDEPVTSDLFSRIHRPYERETHPHCQPIDFPANFSDKAGCQKAVCDGLLELSYLVTNAISDGRICNRFGDRSTYIRRHHFDEDSESARCF
ncbi:hypothetical protein D3C85_1531490 [compost metagenome]